MSLSFVKPEAVKTANTLQDRSYWHLRALLTPIMLLFISPQKTQARQVKSLDTSMRAWQMNF